MLRDSVNILSLLELSVYPFISHIGMDSAEPLLVLSLCTWNLRSSQVWPLGTSFFFSCVVFTIGRVHLPDRQRQTERQKVRNHLPGGMATPQSLLLHSPLGILGTHTHVPGMSFKPPGPGRELWSTTWESSDIAITLTADSQVKFLNPAGFSLSSLVFLFY